MRRGINTVTFGGNLGMDAVVTDTRTGMKLAKFSLAVTTSERNDEGGFEDVTNWFKCVAFGRTAEACDGLAKGSYLIVTGTLKLKKWKSEEGTREYVEIVVKETDCVVEKKAQEAKADDSFGDMPF